jgi:hypothetical protein
MVAGLGVHFPLASWLDLDVDAVEHWLHKDFRFAQNLQLATLQAEFAVHVGSLVEILIAPTFNVLQGDIRDTGLAPPGKCSTSTTVPTHTCTGGSARARGCASGSEWGRLEGPRLVASQPAKPSRDTARLSKDTLESPDGRPSLRERTARSNHEFVSMRSGGRLHPGHRPFRWPARSGPARLRRSRQARLPLGPRQRRTV